MFILDAKVQTFVQIFFDSTVRVAFATALASAGSVLEFLLVALNLFRTPSSSALPISIHIPSFSKIGPRSETILLRPTQTNGLIIGVIAKLLTFLLGAAVSQCRDRKLDVKNASGVSQYRS